MYWKGRLESLKKYYKDEKSTKRDIEYVRQYFDMVETESLTLDDQTWNDLDMDRIFYKLDRTYSSVGEGALYKLLRNPKSDEEILKARSKAINSLKEDKNFRTKLQYIFYDLGFDKKNRFLQMLGENLEVNKFKSIFYSLYGMATMVSLVLTVTTFNVNVAMVLLGLFMGAIYIEEKERKNVSANGLIYLNSVLSAADKIIALDKKLILDNNDKIKSLSKELKRIKSNTDLLKLGFIWNGFFEALLIPFLVVEGSYYRILGQMNDKRDKLLELYYELGKIEAYISVGIYQEIIGEYSEPKFIKEVRVEIEDGIHPLIKEPVGNSIIVDKKGIVLTGTNMSGKSTFLRMLSINVLFAQTFYFTQTSNYKACFFNLISSISPKDDVDLGKSYYLAEAEAVLRIINTLNNKIPVLSIIDEIFRGTNPVERVAAAAAILDYINKSNAITFVATHDKELTDLLKENYDFYYFSEKVDEGGLKFDYKLKTGLVNSRNAIKLLDYIGYPKKIVTDAINFIEASKE